MKFQPIKVLSIAVLALGLFLSCAQTKMAATKNTKTTTPQSGKTVPSNLKWSERMLLSEMNRFPQAWMLDFNKEPRWAYPAAIVLEGAEQLYAKTGNRRYYDYISKFGDTMVKDDGSILTYELDKHNIDYLNCGNVLLYLYQKERKSKYLKALQTLRYQIKTMPRTQDGGFWHKKIYPHQM